MYIIYKKFPEEINNLKSIYLKKYNILLININNNGNSNIIKL